MKTFRTLLCAALLCALFLFTMCSCSAAEIASRNPLLTPAEVTEIETQDEFFNILLLGIDFGGDDYDFSGKKSKLENCHTDGVIVVSINKTDDTISLVSLPRDSLTYVPGVRGIYKLNAAINCADTIEEGLALAREAVSWHLGGIRIDKHIAIDASALVALGDAIGGVDFEVEARFKGNHRWYSEGMQHLDGEGIMAYMHVRNSITKDHNDLGRTRRQREMIKAIFAKVKDNPALIMDVFALYTSGELNIFTDITALDVITLSPLALSIDMEKVSLHVLEGPYLSFVKNFTFNDQEHRQEVIREVYGVDVPQMQYVSHDYTKWLYKYGLTVAKSINVSTAVREHAKATGEPLDTEAYQALDAALDACILAFDQAADTMTTADTNAMNDAWTAMKRAARTAATAYDYKGYMRWERENYWYGDDWINERMLNWN